MYSGRDYDLPSGRLSSREKKIFPCSLCELTYKHRASLRKHMLKKHKVTPGIKTIKCLEQDCGEEFSYVKQLQIHLVKRHGMLMLLENHTFKTMNGNYGPFFFS